MIYMEGEEKSFCKEYLGCSMDIFGPLSIITSGQIASTEKYAFDIGDLSVFCLRHCFILSKMNWGAPSLRNVYLRCSMNTFGL